MTNKFLDSLFINKSGPYAVHPEATHWNIKRKILRFYRCNPSPTSKMNPVPRNVNTLEFPDYKVNRGDIDYGEPRFKGHSEYNAIF